MSESNDVIVYTERRCRQGWACLVAIIIIFVGLMVVNFVGSLPRIPEKGLKTQAGYMCASVVNAMNQFELAYSSLPRPAHVPPGRDYDTDTSGAAGVISTLKGYDEVGNPKGIDYLGEVKDAKTLEGPRHVDGLYRESETVTAIYDPWGRPYLMRVDGDGDGGVDDPCMPGAKLGRSVIVWSAGKDGDPATWRDNVSSWDRQR